MDEEGGAGWGGGVATAYYRSDSPDIPDFAEYNVEVAFQGDWTAALQWAVIDAANLIASVIASDVPDALVSADGATRVVDDILFTAALAPIDSEGRVIGQGGPTAIRVAGDLPALAALRFDEADAEAMQESGAWPGVVLHEMLHGLGFGTLWAMLGLVEVTGDGAFYTGANGNAWFQALYPDLAAQTGGRIPVETDGSAGTAYTHWDEGTFGNEVMTGYVDGAAELSAMTIGSLADLGYALAPEYVLV
ncbi:leishmanolysin-related zinc metalloendopeptidase [Falsiroseomonas sp. HW251]|uniref:leishmanolysin-related zinc metalloendopeptidase n=1 Tax=Falsiroseomonas sp. HW251 TaxID=3390998 RepID=UPI003D31D628